MEMWPLANCNVVGGSSETSTLSLGFALCSLSCLLLITTLYLATALKSQPLDQLGMRPHGSNLWSWLYHYFKDNVGIQGYDAIQGALSPPLRLACHVSTCMMLWGSFLCAIGAQNSNACQMPTIVQSSIFPVTLYSAIMFVIHHVMRAVSMPGGPRPHKIQRQPQWKQGQLYTLDPLILNGWKCLVAEESHQATESKFAQELVNSSSGEQTPKLTGEPAGRQTWFHVRGNEKESFADSNGGGLLSRVLGAASPSRKSTSNNGVDEELVQTMALGGRSKLGFDPSTNPNSNDQIFRAQQIRKYLQRPGNKAPNMEKSSSSPTTVYEACHKAAHFYGMLQCEDGHWAADYGGPHFLMPGLVVAWYIMGKPQQLLDDDQVTLLKHYILVHQQVDGGWGTHIESPSTMFGSVLMYVALRLLGVPADHRACVLARIFLDEHGGALYTSSWSKFYLCLLGVMDWRGHNSVPPEMWLLPNWFPFHPGRMWCHARMVYLPMGYLYGNRYVYSKAEEDPLVADLRRELYPQYKDYSTIPWMKTRHWIAETDNYSPIPWVMKTVQNILARYEEWSIFQPFKKHVRKMGVDFSLEYMDAEDLQTNYIDIGPVNKVLNMISHFHATGGDLKNYKIVNHMMRVQDYLWIAEDGMKMQGYNGSQCWDSAFCIQALYEADLLDEFPELTRKAWSYFERTQILSTEVSQSSPAYQFEANEYRLKFYRHISEGGWPFSTSAHGWPISDCTSEGLKATLCLLKTKTIQGALKSKSVLPISEERLHKAINVLLTYQNEDGGWATYENNRGWGWYEQLNPSEVFGDIMIDYSYVECSMAVLTSLVDFSEMYPDHRTADIQESINRGRTFLKSIQREDGSWYGSWACCFCYGIWFGVEGLIKCGEPTDSPCITKACEFLLRQQRANGGWGEDFTSCYDKDYAQEGMKAYGDDGSGVVSTAWALMALSMAKFPNVEAVRRGVQYLIKRQLPCGDWPQEGIAGVFNRSVGITYTAYRNVFPIWAMGRCREVYGDALDEQNDNTK
ncbi:S-2,3-epoxysqualene cyclase [Nitzschia inconspicua]|uniref:S-2,3-epoxysqualene cyclase n=1 Tax=Nitzschia inconspicua TaxID=303405 RepID=A0A9K3PIL4_9STRA|nr:S-2,3-epoxysqualene cyclase [Nitzschia inconspicua]